jgi:hypothetical protein
MCTVLLPPGSYPIAVNKYIISYILILKQQGQRNVIYTQTPRHGQKMWHERHKQETDTKFWLRTPV